MFGATLHDLEPGTTWPSPRQYKLAFDLIANYHKTPMQQLVRYHHPKIDREGGLWVVISNAITPLNPDSRQQAWGDHAGEVSNTEVNTTKG